MSDHVLVVETDPELNKTIVNELRRQDFHPESVNNWAALKEHLANNEPDLILLGLPTPSDGGKELLWQLVAEYPVALLCAEDQIESAMVALGKGAAEYLIKPVQPQELVAAIRRIIDNALLYRKQEVYTTLLKAAPASALVGNSSGLMSTRTKIDAVAPTDVTVLILGESGVGKERVAEEIHRRSARADKPLMAVDCCSLQESLFESELFGHERGAFTGAAQRKQGLIEGARHGTLFLDEIGEIPLTIQAKLLRVLETRTYRRVGGTADLSADVRIVAATNRDLEAMVHSGDFREDLLYRLNAFVVQVPPLRERRDDIPLLVENFLSHDGFATRSRKKVTQSAMASMMEYGWPGNIRELRNVLERAIILSGHKLRIDTRHLMLPQTEVAASSAVTLQFDHEPKLAEIQHQYLQILLTRYNGHRAKVARVLGVSERNLYRLLAKLGSS